MSADTTDALPPHTDADDLDDDVLHVDPPAIDGLGAEALEQADFHLSKIRFWHGRQAEINHVYRRAADRLRAQLAEMDERYNAETAKIAARIAWHETPVLQLHVALRRIDPKRTSIKLPNGTLTSKVGQPKIDVDDEATLPWLRESMPDLIRTTEAVKKDELRKIVRITNGVAVDEHGELIPGVAVSPALTKFTLEVDGVKFGGIEVDLSPAPKAEVEVEPGEEAGAA